MSNRKNKKYGKQDRAQMKPDAKQVDAERGSKSGTPKLAFANDPSWYAKNPLILRDAGSFSFNNPLGNIEDLGFGTSEFTEGANKYAFPGIITFKMVGIPGVGDSESDALNIAASDQYAVNRYLNSGHANYEPADQMIYFMTLDNAYMFYAWVRRLSGTLSIYTQSNKYWPRYLVESQDVDFDDLIANIAQFRAWANQFADMLKPYKIPDEMPIFRRHWDLYSSYYTDADTTKSQVYIYTPAGFYHFEPYTDTKGGKLVYEVLTTSANPTGSLTFKDIQAIGQTLIDGILNIDDNGIIAGDLLKSHSSFFVLPEVVADYMVVPVYSKEMLMQIENATIFDGNLSGAAAQWSGMDITQANGLLAFTPQLEALAANSSLTAYASGMRLMNFDHPDPTPEEVMVASRLIFNGEYSGTGTKFTVTDAGTELVLGAFVYAFNAKKGLLRYQIATFNDVGSSVSGNYFNEISRCSNFDHHPLIFTFITDATGGNEYVNVLGDIDNYRFFSEQEIRSLNHTALLSEFNVPAKKGQ